MLTLIGVDLAWTAKNPSGICVVEIEGDVTRVVDFDARCVTPAEVTGIAARREGDVVISVDAPLVLTEGRQAERQLARVYGGKKFAAPYQASEKFLRSFDAMAGPDLGAELLKAGFTHCTFERPTAGPARWMLEVYPHAAHVSLFNLGARWKYKKGRLFDRRAALGIFQLHVAALFATEWSGLLQDDRVLAALDPSTIPMGGRELKDLEDRLDALTCLFVAHHAWLSGGLDMEVYGDAETGAIVVPRWPDSKPWLPL